MQWAKGGLAYIIATLINYTGSAVALLSSVFLSKARMTSSELSKAIQAYCSHEFNKVNIGPREYCSACNYVKSIDEHSLIAFELSSSRDGLSIYYRWPKFLIIKREADSMGDRAGNIGVFFSPYLIDIDSIIKKAVNHYKARVNYQDVKRFSVNKVYGKLLKLNHSNHDEATAEDSSWFTELLRTGRPISFDRGDIGRIDGKTNPLNNLVFPDKVWSYVHDIGRWMKSKSWYKSKRIPWKRGWILYGKPGTGKTSLVRSLGEYLDMPIYSFDLSSFTDQCLSEEWQKLKTKVPCIALLEDIDGVFSERSNTAAGSRMQQSLSFDCLLNIIDGVDNSDGIFTIVTTNNIDKVDEALVGEFRDGEWTGRPGRIDVAIELGEIDEKCRQELAKRILADCPNEITQAVVSGTGMTPAQFQYSCEKIALKNYWNKEDKKRKIMINLAGRE